MVQSKYKLAKLNISGNYINFKSVSGEDLKYVNILLRSDSVQLFYGILIKFLVTYNFFPLRNILDKIIPLLHIFSKREQAEGIETNWQKTVLLVLAIALHNIPEGLAVGVAFGALANPELLGMDGHSVFTIGGAIALGIGIGIQNFPEGFAVSMPLTTKRIT